MCHSCSPFVPGCWWLLSLPGTVRQNTVDSELLTQLPKDKLLFLGTPKKLPHIPSVSEGPPSSPLATSVLIHRSSQLYRNMGGK